MHARGSRYGGLLGAACAVALAAACSGPKSSQGSGAAGAKATHPQVDTGLDTCFSCHSQATPQVATQWKDSRHGLVLVECLVCHGSTGADFRARPEPSGCRGCHPTEVASVTRDGATQRCFGCHPPHALHAAGGASPHATTAKGARP